MTVHFRACIMLADHEQTMMMLADVARMADEARRHSDRMAAGLDTLEMQHSGCDCDHM